MIQRNISRSTASSRSPATTGRILCVLLVAATLIASCQPSEKSIVERRSRAKDNSSAQDSLPDLGFDPLGAPGDRTIVAETYKDSIPVAHDGDSSGLAGLVNPASDGLSETDSVSASYDTYRIQLFNSRVFTESSREKAIAQEIFDRTATLDYEVPYFKVRIGDFADRKIADKYLRNYVKPAGYPNSWVTRVRIVSNSAPLSDSALSAYYDSLRNAVLVGDTLFEVLDSLLDSLDNE